MDELDYVEYNRSLIEYARENRKNPTKQEYIFRKLVLKDKKFLGYKFTRQKAISSFILDFYCSKLLLGIEIDGGYHNERGVYDLVRDSEIYKKGILVVRFTNEEVDNNLDGIVEYLKDIVKKRVSDLKKI